MPKFQTFKPFNRFAQPALSTAEGFNSPSLVLPRDAGEEEVGTRT
jgi:hypothetical protein